MARPPAGDLSASRPTRTPIVRGEGVTPTEKHLGRLADRSFLNLWSYPNPFRDQKAGKSSIGKELCDVLVVCGDHVLIFSEKTCAWPQGETDVSWCRWYKRAIQKSVDQIRGAERWIKEHPSRIFLDPECTVPFPLDLPPPERAKIHGIVVAGGAGEACRRHFKGGSGSMVIRPAISGSQHWTMPVEPFRVGDVDPVGSFIHVLDDGSLNFVLRELDTITDFTAYLEKKAAFIRSGRLIEGHGEEDLLAYYAVRINADDQHDFTPPDDSSSWDDSKPIVIDGSHFPSLVTDPRYVAKRNADKISYAWDSLIETFTVPMLNGTSYGPESQQYDLRKSERGVREMALESRFERRGHGEAVVGALRESRNRHAFFRSMIPGENSGRTTGFFFLTVQNDPRFGGYEEYRKFRSNFGELYAEGLLLRYRYLDKIVGIITEPAGRGEGSSEDMLYAPRQEWTSEEEAEIQDRCARAGILRPDYKERKWAGTEFPDVPIFQRVAAPQRGGNRKARRAAEARSRKKK